MRITGACFARIGVFLLVLMMLSGGCKPTDGAQPAATRPAKASDKRRPATLEETITVDLDRNLGELNGRLTGFARVISGSSPPEAMLSPLKPALLVQPAGQRGGGYRALAACARAEALGAQVQAALGDSLKFEGRYPGENEKWDLWEREVRELAQQARRQGIRLQWDVWNEPDRGNSWKGSKNAYFRCWYRTVRIIREIDPQAVIVGPSISHFDGGWLEGFMKDAKDFGVLPTMISWHETSAKPDIVGHVNSFEENCWQDGLGFRRFCINQTIGRDQALSAGVPVFYLAQLERARVQSAARAHFGEHGYQLSSLLTPDFQPRAAWWVYRMYTGLRGERPKVSSSTAMDGLAAYDSADDTLRVLVGRDWARSGKRPSEKPLFGEAKLKLAHVPGKSVHVIASVIPATRERACEGPAQRVNGALAVDQRTHEVVFSLPELEDGGAYWVQVRLEAKPMMKRWPEDQPSAFDTRIKM